MEKKKIFILLGLVLFLCVTSSSKASEWELLNGELNVPRPGLTGEALNGYLYAIAGVGSPYAQNTVSRYDPNTDSWSLLDCQPTARHSLSSAVIDSCIYAVGGHVTNSRSENERYCGTCPWQSRASVYARSGPGVAAYGGKMYVFGGNRYGTKLSRVDIYDPNTDTWSSGCDMPAATEPWRAVTLYEKIYVPVSHVDPNKIWCYDPNSCTWDTNVPAMNVPRTSFELQAVCGRIYAIGGNGSSGTISSVESWAPGEASWTMGPSLNIGRAGFASAVIGNDIYVFGGGNSGGALGSTEVLHIGPVVLSPNGGEELVSGNKFTIEWDSDEVAIPNVLLECSTDGGQNWNDVNTVANTGSYEWLIPEVTSPNCLVCISDANDANIYDTSNNVFTIFECQIRFQADLNGDCRVDFYDFSILAGEWLEDGNPFGPGCALWSTDGNTVALWHLNGNGNDNSGNDYHLQVHPTNPNAVSWGYAKYCFGAVMGEDDWSGGCENSTGAALTTPGAGCTYPGSGDWTVEAWVCFPSNSETYYAVSHYSKHWAGHDPYALYISNGQAGFLIEDSSNNSIFITGDISGYAGQWVHIAGVYRYQQDLALYVNGVRVAYDTTTLIPEYLPGYDVFVGGCYCGTSTGLKVDEVRISDTARYVD
jgi:hypothetical protein